MNDRRQQIIDAGLEILREEGLRGFTQPRIATSAGLRQSHLTYYFPTRTDLIAGVAQAAIEIQLGAAAEMVSSTSNLAQAAERIGELTTRHAIARVLSSLAQAADQEPEVQVLFNRLTDGLAEQIRRLFEKLGIAPDEANVDLLHSMVVGLSVVDLATSRKDGKARAQRAVTVLLAGLAAAPPNPAKLKGQ